MTDAVKPATDGVVISRELVAFLCGDGPLDGHYFGEKPDHERGNFWWRKALRAAEQAALEQAGEPVAKLHYSGDVMEAVQQLLERGRATLDGEGYLVANLPQSREPSLTHNSVQIIDGPCDHKWAAMTVTGHMSCINCRQTRPMTALEAAQLTTPQSRGQAFDGEGEAVSYPRPAIWEVHEKDCEAMRRPRADCTCGPTLMEICPDCSGAGGDNNVSTCARCNGSGGAAQIVAIFPANPVADAGGVTEADRELHMWLTGYPLDDGDSETVRRIIAHRLQSVAAATAASEQIRLAAHKALGEWLAWPDAARDGPAPVDDSKVLSWLGGVAQKLGTIDAKDAEIARLREALLTINTIAAVQIGGSAQGNEAALKMIHDKTEAALSEAREAGDTC